MLLLGRGCCWGRRACGLEGELTQLRLRAWEPWFQYSEFKLSEKCLFPWTWMLSLVSNHDEWLVCPLKASLCKSRCESNNLTFLPEFFLENVVLTKKYKIACKLFVQFTIMIVKHNNFEFFFWNDDWLSLQVIHSLQMIWFDVWMTQDHFKIQKSVKKNSFYPDWNQSKSVTVATCQD